MSTNTLVPFKMVLVGGDSCVSTTMSYKIKELLLRAWRERWSELEFGRSIKRLLPRGVSGDVYDLAECILQQSITGPVPNQLLLSYLNHCLCSQVVSFGACMLAITKLSDPKPNCVNTLLEFLLKYKERIVSYGNEDECLILCRSLVAMLQWLYQVISNALNELQQSSNGKSGTKSQRDTRDVGGLVSESVHLSTLKLSAQVFTYFQQSAFLKALLFIGKLEEPSLWAQWCQLYAEVKPKLAVLTDKQLLDANLVQMIGNFQNKVEWLDVAITGPPHMVQCAPIVHVAIKQITQDQRFTPYRTAAYRCLQAVIAFTATLDHSIPIEVITNRIAAIARFYDIDLSRIYCECLHISLVGMIDAHNHMNEDTKGHTPKSYFHGWIAFVLFKLPYIFVALSQRKDQLTYYATATRNLYSSTPSKTKSDLEVAIEMLQEREALLDTCSIKFTNEYFLKIMDTLEKVCDLSPDAVDRFLKFRKITATPLRLDKKRDPSQEPILVCRAINGLETMLATMDTNISHDSIMSLLVRIEKSVDIILSGTSSTGSLGKLVQKMIAVNEACRESSGENSQFSQVRAVMFDFTFLYLCLAVQNYGTELVTQNPATKDSFFAKWCAVSLNSHRHSPETMLNTFADPKMETSMTQWIVGNPNAEYRTFLVNWGTMAGSAQHATSAVLTAWSYDVLTNEAVKLFVERLKKPLCFPAVSAACWLLAQKAVAPQQEVEKLEELLKDLKPNMAHLPAPSEIFLRKDATKKIDIFKVSDIMSLCLRERTLVFDRIMKNFFYKYKPSQTPTSKMPESYKSQPSGIRGTVVYSVMGPPENSSRSHLNDLLVDALTAANGHFLLKNIQEFNGLMMLGGVQWFTINVCNYLLDTHSIAQLQQHVDIAYGLFHLDLEHCALVMMREVIPRALLSRSQQSNLSEPRVSALIRLTVRTTATAIRELQLYKACKVNCRHDHRRHYRLGSIEDMQISELSAEELENTLYCYEIQNKPTNSGNGEINNGEKMEVDEEPTQKRFPNVPIQKCDDSILDHRREPEQLIKEPLYCEFIRFLRNLLELALDSEFEARSLVIGSLLEQLVYCLREESHQFMQFVPFHLLDGIVRSAFDILSFEQLLSYLSLDSVRARKIGARLLCQLHLSKESGIV